MSAPAGSAAPPKNISGYKLRQTPNFTPDQMQLFQKLIGGLSGSNGLSGGLDFLSRLAGGEEGAFDQAEKPAYSAFQKSLGQIGSRFAGLGGGALDSSAFQGATSGAARELAENLGEKRINLQNDAINRLLGLSSNLLGQRPYEYSQQEKGGFDLAGTLGSLLGFAGGPAAGVVGSRGLPQLLKLLGLG